MAMRARKRFGQHFLHDPRVVEKIIAAIRPQADDNIVEIGGGHGALTVPLLDKIERLQVIELDRDLAAELASITPESGTLTVHAADALKIDYAELLPDNGRPLRIVGNLPYNISTPLLFRLLSFRPLIQDMHLMLQKEVVDRMTALPGGKQYGRLTVMLAPWTNIEACFDIGPGAFKPAPKVWSTFVRVTPRQEPSFELRDEARFARIVALLFSMRRKTIARALKGRIETDQIAAAGIDPGARPETLAASQFARLADLNESI